MSAVSSAQHGVISEQERDRLRRYIAVKVVGDNPPPLSAEARDLIRRTFGPGPDQAEEMSAAA